MEYDYRKVMDFISGTSKEGGDAAIYKFIEAFKAGDVERALEIFEQEHLDEALLVETAKGTFAPKTECPLLLALIAKTFADDKKQIEILTKIIENPKNKSINSKWSTKYHLDQPISDSYLSASSLAISNSLNDVLKALCQRSDIDLEQFHDDTPFGEAINKAKNGDLKPLAIMLKSGKIDLTKPAYDRGQKTYLEYLKKEKDNISKTIAKILKKYEPDAEKVAKLKELEKKAEAAKTVERPVEPKKRLFGKKKYEAEMEEYDKQYREYWDAQRDIREYNELKQEVDEEQAVYDKKLEEFEGAFKVIDDATKERPKAKAKEI